MNFFSLVIPVYKNEANIDDLVTALENISARIGVRFEAVFVVDGSPDQSHALLQTRLKNSPLTSQLLKLSRNFGSFAAIRAGLAAGRGDAFGVLAADLQEPPELILDFAKILATGTGDLVVAARRTRKDAWGTRVSAGIFWSLYRRFVISEIPPGGVDIFACSRRFRDHLLSLQENHSSLIGLLYWTGFSRVTVEYDRQERTKGKSAWTFRKKFRYMVDSCFSFTDIPVRMLTVTGLLGVVIAVGMGALVILARLTNMISQPGYSATVTLIVFFGGLNALGLGILGEYLWRTFENSKRRPLYIVEDHTIDPKA